MLDKLRRPRFLVLAALGATLAVSGCGGDSEEDKKKEYSDGLDEAAQTFNNELTKAGATMRAAGQSKSREQYGQGAEALQQATDEFKKELDELEAPSDAENEEEAVTEAVDEFAAAVAEINSAVQADDEQAVQAAVLDVQTKGAEVDKSIETLKEAVE